MGPSADATLVRSRGGYTVDARNEEKSFPAMGQFFPPIESVKITASRLADAWKAPDPLASVIYSLAPSIP